MESVISDEFSEMIRAEDVSYHNSVRACSRSG